MRAGAEELNPVLDSTESHRAAEGPSAGTRQDEEAMLQAAIAMTQLSSASTGIQGEWRQLVFGGEEGRAGVVGRIEEGQTGIEGRIEEEHAEVVDDITEKQQQEEVVMVGAANGVADPEIGGVRTTSYFDGSTRACPARGQEVTGEYSCGMDNTKEEGGEWLPKSCDYVDENRWQSTRNPSEQQIGGEVTLGVLPVAVVDKSDFSEEDGPKGKFVRTAQPSGHVFAPWMTGKCKDGFVVGDKGSPNTSVDEQKMTSHYPKLTKTLRQRKSSRNAPSQEVKSRRGSSKSVRVKSTGEDTPGTSTGVSERNLAKESLTSHAVRGMIFLHYPQCDFPKPKPSAHIAPIPTTIIDAEKHLLAWLPSSGNSAPRVSSVSTKVQPVVSISLPSYTAPRFEDLMPRVTLPSIIPASVSISEDADAIVSSDARAKLPTSRGSGKRGKPRCNPGANGEDIRYGTNFAKHALRSGAFQVEEKEEEKMKEKVVEKVEEKVEEKVAVKMEVDDGRLGEFDKAGNITLNIPITDYNQNNRIIAQRLYDFESTQGVDLSMRIWDNRIGEPPKMADPRSIVIKTEADDNFGSCTSPLDLTTRCGSYGALGSLKGFYTPSGSTTEIEPHQYDNSGYLANSKDYILNRLGDSIRVDCNSNRVRRDESITSMGLAGSFRHGSPINCIKGTTTAASPALTRPTSSMVCGEKKSPFAESTADKYDPSHNTNCSFFSDTAWGSHDSRMCDANPDPIHVFHSFQNGSIHPGSVRDLRRLEAIVVAPVTPSPSPVGGNSCENSGQSRPGSQCSSDMQVESTRSQDECRLPPKKRKVPIDFHLEVQPLCHDHGRLNGYDLSRRSGPVEAHEGISHPEQTLATSGYSRVPDGVRQMAHVLPETSMRGSIPVSSMEFKEESVDEVIKKTATISRELQPSRSSSSPSAPLRTTTNCAAHSVLQPDEDGDLPLHVAVAQGLESVVDSLVTLMSDLGTHIDVFNKTRQTPLHVAVITNQRSIVRKLLLAGACPNLSDRKGHNSIHLAVNNRCHECLRILLSDSKYPVDVDAMNYEGLMPLHLAVQLGEVRSVEALLSFGAQVNGVDGKNGRTALYYAAEKSDLASAELLLQTGASPSIASYSGCLPVNAARSNGAMIKLLDRYSTGGSVVMGSAAAAVGGGVAMATTKTGGRDAKRSKQVKSRD